MDPIYFEILIDGNRRHWGYKLDQNEWDYYLLVKKSNPKNTVLLIDERGYDIPSMTLYKLRINNVKICNTMGAVVGYTCRKVYEISQTLVILVCSLKRTKLTKFSKRCNNEIRSW